MRSFPCDGDGKRVKFSIGPVGNTVDTCFVGNYYEKTGTTETKYYYAGSQRVAVRAGSTLSYLLGDHLGSTSQVIDANGALVTETRYKPLGEVRDATGTTPTDYTFTGQYSNTDDFVLLFYNARWYDVGLGRFAQADSIVPADWMAFDASVNCRGSRDLLRTQ